MTLEEMKADWASKPVSTVLPAITSYERSVLPGFGVPDKGGKEEKLDPIKEALMAQIIRDARLLKKATPPLTPGEEMFYSERLRKNRATYREAYMKDEPPPTPQVGAPEKAVDLIDITRAVDLKQSLFCSMGKNHAACQMPGCSCTCHDSPVGSQSKVDPGYKSLHSVSFDCGGGKHEACSWHVCLCQCHAAARAARLTSRGGE